MTILSVVCQNGGSVCSWEGSNRVWFAIITEAIIYIAVLCMCAGTTYNTRSKYNTYVSRLFLVDSSYISFYGLLGNLYEFQVIIIEP